MGFRGGGGGIDAEASDDITSDVATSGVASAEEEASVANVRRKEVWNMEVDLSVRLKTFGAVSGASRDEVVILRVPWHKRAIGDAQTLGRRRTFIWKNEPAFVKRFK